MEEQSEAVASQAWQANFVEVYEALKRIARGQRRDSSDTLNTTGLVHELYLQLSHRADLKFQNERQLYVYAAQAMRHLLIDRARARGAQRRGGDQETLPLHAVPDEAVPAMQLRVIELDRALAQLQARDARAAEVFHLLFFTGLSVSKVAELLELSTRTVDRDWLFARAWLQSQIDPETAS
jgi:RNA polymerase sigma factor (TIGR02999 family)